MKKINFFLSVFFLLYSCESTNKPLDENNYNVSLKPVPKSGTVYETINYPFPGTGPKKTTYEKKECGENTYPCPPYGYKLYYRLENIPFIPVGDSASSIAGPGGIAKMDAIFRLRNEGYKVLFLTLSAGWCGYCTTQAQILGTRIAPEYSDRVLFLTVVTEDEGYNNATIGYALSYSNTKQLNGNANVFVTDDYNGIFRRLMEFQYLPYNLIIDLRTMDIILYKTVLNTYDLYRNAVEDALAYVN